jgi:pimeloyl-ACP methyl ester carboxylesterase
MSTRRRRGLAGWQVGALATVGAAGGLALANWLSARGVTAPASELPGEEGRYAWEHGDIWYTVKGQGEPLVLIHGVYAGASSYEYRRVFDLLARGHRVFAFDLLGFGRSAHPALVYTPVLYEQLIADFVREVVGGADHPAAVIASTLGAAFTIRAAAERPALFSRLVLIEPTGMENLARANDSLARRAGLALLRSPLVGQAIYNAIASRPSIRFFLQGQTYADPLMVTDAMIEHYYTVAHQPGSRFAAASFISGTLNTPVASLYPLLKQPILLCWGKDARFTPLQNAGAFREGNPRAELRVFDCGALPQDELPDEFAREVGSWLRANSGSRTK